MGDATTTGMATVLAAVLIVAGVIKIVEPRYVAAALRRISGRIAMRAARSEKEARRAGRTVGVVETLVGVALLVVTGWLGMVVAAIAVALFGLFVVVVELAVRRGIACGCWASLSEGPAGGAELGRAGALAAAAVVVLIGRATGARGVAWTAVTFVAALITLAAIVLGTWLGQLALPVRNARVRERLDQRAPKSRLGRVGLHVAFMFGFVHAGTTAGLRRYHDFLNDRLKRGAQAADSADSTPFHRSGSLR
jgi:Methylamine utilisation protein MauE